jgi:lipopolysaccharide biosynthesis glycosyltransferase
MLNITKLEYYYYSKNTQTENLNHIHIGMAFDSNYILLSSISIVSILNTSSKNTYINFHIVLNNCSYDDIKPIISLEKINTRVSFIFYNGKQAEYDFIRGLNERRGIGEYSRLLIPEIVNNTNKILILDSADILAIKDLSEIFFFELGNYYYAFSLENSAGRFTDDFIFSRNNFYPNGGVTLLNTRKFREDKLYRLNYKNSVVYENYWEKDFF